MKSMQSFLMFFYILDQCYDRCQENDLGGLLGAISPELWGDGRPMDIAVYHDWEDRINTNDINNQNIIRTIYRFLEDYEKLFGYNFQETKNILITSMDNAAIAEAAEYANGMYQKYAYEEFHGLL